MPAHKSLIPYLLDDRFVRACFPKGKDKTNVNAERNGIKISGYEPCSIKFEGGFNVVDRAFFHPESRSGTRGANKSVVIKNLEVLFDDDNPSFTLQNAWMMHQHNQLIAFQAGHVKFFWNEGRNKNRYHRLLGPAVVELFGFEWFKIPGTPKIKRIDTSWFISDRQLTKSQIEKVLQNGEIKIDVFNTETVFRDEAEEFLVRMQLTTF